MDMTTQPPDGIPAVETVARPTRGKMRLEAVGLAGVSLLSATKYYAIKPISSSADVSRSVDNASRSFRMSASTCFHFHLIWQERLVVDAEVVPGIQLSIMTVC